MLTSPSDKGTLKPILFVLCVILLLAALNACVPTGMAAAKLQNCVYVEVSAVTKGSVHYVKSTATDVQCKTAKAKMTDYYCNPATAKGISSTKRACNDPAITTDSDYVQVPSKTKGAVALCDEIGGVVTVYDVAANPPETAYTYTCSGKKIKAKAAASDEGRAGPRLDKDFAVQIIDSDIKRKPGPGECEPCTSDANCAQGTICAGVYMHSTFGVGNIRHCISSNSCKDSSGANKCDMYAGLNCTDSTGAARKSKCTCPAGTTCDQGPLDVNQRRCVAPPAPVLKDNCQPCSIPGDCKSGLCVQTNKGKQCLSDDRCANGACGEPSTGCSDGGKYSCGYCPDTANTFCNTEFQCQDKLDLCRECRTGSECKTGNCLYVLPQRGTRLVSICTQKSEQEYECGTRCEVNVTECNNAQACQCLGGKYCSRGYCNDFQQPPTLAGCTSPGNTSKTMTASIACNPVPPYFRPPPWGTGQYPGSVSACQTNAYTTTIKICGAVPDGCGCSYVGKCGSCGGSSPTCIDNRCRSGSCTPKLERSPPVDPCAGWECGNAPDGCDGTVFCGDCTGTKICKGGHTTPATCCTPRTKEAACQGQSPGSRPDNNCNGWHTC